MQQHSRKDLYRSFIDFIHAENQRERSAVNRRMRNVFFWCFFLPAIVSLSILVLVKVGIFPRSTRAYLDWLVLIFPVLYSVYFLSFEVLREAPKVFSKASPGPNLRQAVKEGEWRERVCESMRRAIHASSQEWRWVCASFRMDIQAMQYRTRYLTALAGAVFFLIMQGIDSLTDEPAAAWQRHPVFGWVETTSNDFSQFAGLALFLVLLYLSGSQANHNLKRYLDCAELIAVESEEEQGGRGTAPREG